MISHLLVLASLAVTVALLAGASARLPRLRRMEPEPASVGRPLPPEIRRAIEAGMAGLPLQHQAKDSAGPSTVTLASQPRHRARHHVAAAIRHHIGSETTTAVAMPSAGRKSNVSSSDGSSSVAAPGS